MSKSNVVALNAIRELKAVEQEDDSYHIRVLGMDKLELLEEMVRFQEERTRAGHLTLGMMIRGKHLFRELERTAETNEMRILTSSYRRHLEHELAAFRRDGKLNYGTAE